MFLSKRPNGVYYLYYTKQNGKRTSVSTKTKLKSEANKFLINFSGNLKKVNEKSVLPISLKSFTDEFEKHSEVVHTYWTNYTYKQTFRFLNKYFSGDLLNDLNAKDINRYIEHRIRSASIYQARKDLINICAAFNWGLLQGYIDENPCDKIKKIKVPQKLPLYYTKDEFAKLMETITEEDIKDIVLFAVNTGMRQMELLTLMKDQIDLAERIVILNNHHHITKGKRVRTIPLNRVAYDIVVKRLQLSNEKNVFTYKGEVMTQDFLSHKFAGYVDDAKINSKLNFHSLRHTFASWLVQKGVSIYEVSKLLGHSEIKTTQIYAHLRNEDLRNVVEQLE